MDSLPVLNLGSLGLRGSSPTSSEKIEIELKAAEATMKAHKAAEAQRVQRLREEAASLEAQRLREEELARRQKEHELELERAREREAERERRKQERLVVEAEAEVKRKAEAEAGAEAEVKRKAEAEAGAEAEVKRKAEAEAGAEAEAKQKAESKAAHGPLGEVPEPVEASQKALPAHPDEQTGEEGEEEVDLPPDLSVVAPIPVVAKPEREPKLIKRVRSVDPDPPKPNIPPEVLPVPEVVPVVPPPTEAKVAVIPLPPDPPAPVKPVYKSAVVKGQACKMPALDPFKRMPIDSFEPPPESVLEDVLTWEDHVKEMVSRVSKIQVGGEPLRLAINDELKKMSIIRFNLFCKYV